MIDLNKVMNELRYRKTFLLAHDLQKNINFEVDISHIDSIFESNAYESENIITKVENFCINLLLKIKFVPSKLDFFNKENNLKISSIIAEEIIETKKSNDNKLKLIRNLLELFLAIYSEFDLYEPFIPNPELTITQVQYKKNIVHLSTKIKIAKETDEYRKTILKIFYDYVNQFVNCPDNGITIITDKQINRFNNVYNSLDFKLLYKEKIRPSKLKKQNKKAKEEYKNSLKK